MSELLAPAGDFQSAIVAFENGADAIYVGLQQFSARKSAINISIQELQRLKTKATLVNKKIYITLNTIIKESEFEELYKTLAFISALQIDAVIIQDLGALNFIKKYFPKIVVHASTQMAIHNSAGLAMACDLGISRVVLSRELSLQNIKDLREKNRQIELEVFIHGALCYSFSGMCLASGLILGRSGNRGRCAQLCRNYFEQDNNYKFFFSCNDLHLGKQILKLRDIGITSFKIEGRMKPKEYIQTTLALYRAILDKKTLSDEEYNKLVQAETLTFSRKKTEAYFHNNHGNNLINNLNSGHQGIPLGTVTKVEGKTITIKLVNDLHLNDLILFLKNGINKIRFVAFTLKNVSGKKVPFVPAGATAITAMENYDTPTVGSELLLIDHPTNDLKEIDYKKITPTTVPINCEIIAHENTLIFEINHSPKLRYSFDVTFESAKGNSNFSEVLQKFLDESGESFYKLNIKRFTNQTTHLAIFARPSELKKIKNELYFKLSEELFVRGQKKIVMPALSLPPIAEEMQEFLSQRKNLNPGNGKLPFATIQDLKNKKLKKKDNIIFVPLMPILLDEKNYFAELTNLVTENNNDDIQYCLGINNISHLSLVKNWNITKQKNISWFVDFYFYVANSYSLDLVTKTTGALLFAYAWVEEKSWNNQLVEIKDKEQLPLFISQGCYHKHNINGGNCPPTCSKQFDYHLTNGKKQYSLIIDDCLNYLFLKK